jgi:hypothetical protein
MTDNPIHIQTFCVAFENSIIIKVELLVVEEDIVKI